VSGPANTFANRTIVELADRRDFSGGAGEEGFVRGIDFITRDAFFHQRQADFGGELNDGVAGDAFQRGCERSGV